MVASMSHDVQFLHNVVRDGTIEYWKLEEAYKKALAKIQILEHMVQKTGGGNVSGNLMADEETKEVEMGMSAMNIN